MSKLELKNSIFPTKWRANEQSGGGGSHQPEKDANKPTNPLI